jgi:integrase
MQAKGPRLRPRTAASYHDAFRLTLSGWRDKPLREIRRADVEQLHRQRSKQTKAGADGAMRVLSAVMNFAADMVADSGEPLDNPVRRLSAQSLWNKPPRRTAIIPFDKLPAWIAAVRADPSPVQSAYLLTLLGTGLRRREASRLLWTDIDLSAATLTLRPEETKSGRGTTLPLPSQVLALLKALPQAGPWAFPDANGNPIDDARTALERAGKATGLAVTHHDLRRTYATAADAVGLGSYTIKRLVNHAAQGGGQDVTAGYVQAESGTLAAASQRIADYLFR